MFMGVFPKCFTEFSDKNICHYSKRAWTCNLLCKRPGFYHNAHKTHVRDGIFKLTLIHALVICQITWIHWKCSLFNAQFLLHSWEAGPSRVISLQQAKWIVPLASSLGFRRCVPTYFQELKQHQTPPLTHDVIRNQRKGPIRNLRFPRDLAGQN